MQITDELMDKIASLARLSFSQEEKEAYKADFQKMLDFVDQLQEVDTEGVEPLIHMTEEWNHLRDDKPAHTISKEDALKNAPQADDNFFYVPKVIDK
ncbi:MAG: Asp-tRNA(Asn)/Glu-tRNA(Gln) amidotransferase subunit GatC [Bacteroidota bacterium]